MNQVYLCKSASATLCEQLLIYSKSVSGHVILGAQREQWWQPPRRGLSPYIVTARAKHPEGNGTPMRTQLSYIHIIAQYQRDVGTLLILVCRLPFIVSELVLSWSELKADSLDG